MLMPPSASASPMASFTLTARQQGSPAVVPVDLVSLQTGSGEWENVSDVMRQTFRGVVEALRAQAHQSDHLSNLVSQLRRELNSRASEGDVRRMEADLRELRGEVMEIKEMISAFGGIASTAALSVALESKASQGQLDDLSARVSTLSNGIGAAEMRSWQKLSSRTKELDEGLSSLGKRVDVCEVHASRLDVGDIMSRLEKLRAHVSRKADAAAVEEALQGKANRASVAAALHQKARKENIAQLEQALQEHMRHVDLRVQELRNQQQGREDIVGELVANTKVIGEEVEGMAASVGELEDLSTSIRQRLIKCESLLGVASQSATSLSSTGGAATALLSSISDCRHRLDSLEPRLAEVEQYLHERIDDHEMRLEEAEHQVLGEPRSANLETGTGQQFFHSAQSLRQSVPQRVLDASDFTPLSPIAVESTDERVDFTSRIEELKHAREALRSQMFT
jgi:chromosome segregation ATPase